MEKIITFRHGADSKQYDKNGKELNTTVWEQKEIFNCVEAVMLSSENTMAYNVEQERRNKRFYIEVRNQSHTDNFDIKLGDYLFEPDCREYWWKILSVVEQEITCNCWWLIITGEELTERERDKLRIQNVARI